MVNQIEQTLTNSHDVTVSFIEVSTIANNTADNTERSAAAASQGSASMEEILILTYIPEGAAWFLPCH